MFEGDNETKAPEKFVNSKIYLAVSVIGCLFSLISFILALIDKKTNSCTTDERDITCPLDGFNHLKTR